MHTKPMRYTLTVMVSFLLSLLPFSTAAAPQAEPLIYPVYLTNVRDNTFTVSWTTDILSNGSVTYGTGIPSSVVNDPVASTTTHSVTLSGLLPNTTYNFFVQSGATLDDNSGAYYQVTTGPSLLFTPGNTVWGYVYESDGVTVVPNAIVYLQLQDADSLGSSGVSQWVSARSDSAGVWSFDLTGVRTADLQNLFIYTNGVDHLKIIGQGGIKGTFGVDPNPWVVPIPTTYPQQYDIILSQDPTAVTFLDMHAANAMPVAIPLVVAVGLVGMLAVASLAWRKNKAVQN